MDVSIIIPLYNPNINLINRIKTSLSSQNFKGSVEILFEKGGGLSENLNRGILKSKAPIIVTLHQDCIPSSKDWLSSLIKPLKNKSVVASVSDVEMPYSFWKKFDVFSKILTCKELGVITPLLDEKGCAYKKNKLIEVNLFDSKYYRTAGEDFDIYLKLISIGFVIYPHTKVFHYHSYSWRSRLRKEYQLANGFGALVRRYKNRIPKYYIGFIKSFPIIGFPLFFKGISFKKLKFLIFLSPFVLFIAHFQYVRGFWKGFIKGAQTV